MRIIDADAHLLEPPTLWTGGLERRFRDRAPHIEKDPNGRKGSFFVWRITAIAFQSPFPTFR